MDNNPTYDSLAQWQKAFVKREALAICRSNKAYLHLEAVLNGEDHEASVHADEVMHGLRSNAMEEVLNDPEFMESISVEEEDRFMTRGNNALR